jgi:hypothetical protein
MSNIWYRDESLKKSKASSLVSQIVEADERRAGWPAPRPLELFSETCVDELRGYLPRGPRR